MISHLAAQIIRMVEGERETENKEHCSSQRSGESSYLVCEAELITNALNTVILHNVCTSHMICFLFLLQRLKLEKNTSSEAVQQAQQTYRKQHKKQFSALISQAKERMRRPNLNRQVNKQGIILIIENMLYT